MTLLPPQSTPLERGLEGATARLGDVPVDIARLWNPTTCPADFLPWLGWGLSIDFWDAAWTEAEKREAIGSAIEDQRRKGTLASLREVIDRFDPMIRIVEWFEDPDTLQPHTFRLELPLAAETAVDYDEPLVRALLRDIGTVKPLRSHMRAVHRIAVETNAFLTNGAQIAGFSRYTGASDIAVTADPIWADYLQTEDGEPVTAPDGEFLDAAPLQL